jgi:thiol-disulfide isomerase/thioredoxin
LATGDADSAETVLEASLEEYPEFGLTRKTLGGIYEVSSRPAAAAEQFSAAVALQPFDPELQLAMARLGGSADRARRERYLEILRKGGEDRERASIHDIEGTYELPDYDQSVQRKRERSGYRDKWIGEPAPNYFGTDIDGKSIFADKYLGSVVVLDFWATWCGPCRLAMPKLSALRDARAKEGVEVIGFSDEPTRKVAPFIAKNPVSYRIAANAAGVKRRYEVSSLPTAFVVGRDGRIVEVLVGWSDTVHKDLEDAVERALQAPEN